MKPIEQDSRAVFINARAANRVLHRMIAQNLARTGQPRPIERRGQIMGYILTYKLHYGEKPGVLTETELAKVK